MSTAIDDILGGTTSPPVEDTPYAQRKRIMIAATAGKGTFVEAGELKRPVTKNFLAMVFDMDPATITKRLLTCPEIGREGGNRPLYDFKQAVAYLIEPKMDLNQYIKSIDPNKLPNHINKIFWEAQRGRLKYKLEASEAWNSADVIDVFGEVFMTIKDRMQLWTETLQERGGINDATMKRLQQMVDALQEDLHEKLVDIPNKRQTPAVVAELDDLLDADAT